MTMTEKNIMRARRIYSQIANYPDGVAFYAIDDIFTEERVRENAEDEGIIDALTDIMHLCELTGLDFSSLARMAAVNYEEERIERDIEDDDEEEAEDDADDDAHDTYVYNTEES